MVAAAQKSILEQQLTHRAECIEKELGKGEGAEHRRRLREIREALKRLGTETYGFCDRCFMTIPWGELLERPERHSCERCAPAAESA